MQVAVTPSLVTRSSMNRWWNGLYKILCRFWTMQPQGMVLCMLTIHYIRYLGGNSIFGYLSFNSLQGGLKNGQVLSKSTFFSKSGGRLKIGAQDDWKKHFYEASFGLEYWNTSYYLENTSKKTIIKPFFGQAPIDPESHHLWIDDGKIDWKIRTRSEQYKVPKW